MLNLFEYQRAVHRILSDAGDLGGAGVKVVMDEAVNEDPKRCPWLGVYRETNRYDTAKLGAGDVARWEANPTLLIIAQEQAIDSGAACGEKLEALLQRVLTLLFTDGLLNSEAAPSMLNELSVDYLYSPLDTKGRQRPTHYQSAVIRLNLTVENQ